MAHLGNFALMVALAFSIFGTAVSFLSAINRRASWLDAGVRAFIVATLGVLVATISLAHALLTDQFQLTYVQNYSNVTLPTIFKLTALWAGQAGSLLFWSLTLCVYFCIALALLRGRRQNTRAWSYGLIGLAVVFSLLINNLVANPFAHWAEISPDGTPIPFQPSDGNGLNPQLQHWAMIIHPPLLYIGYIGFLFPFAFTLGALLTRTEARLWIPWVRRWTLAAWLILGVGIVLGAAWAYMELGWGGYWAWDPVENASLIPWLFGAAFLHTVIAQERRGLFKKWNVALIVATYLLCIFGTFITRSGIISSVHAFAESNIGRFYLTYLGLNLLFAVVVMILRRDQLIDDRPFDSPSSRESGMLYGSVLFLAIGTTTFLATLYPMFTELFLGAERELHAPFYNAVELPIFLGLIFLMAIGPMLTWRKTEARRLWYHLMIPAIAAFVVGLIAWIGPVGTHLASASLAILAFGFTAWCQDVLGEIHTMARSSGHNPLLATSLFMRRKPQRFGAMLAHLGVLAMGLGVTGGAFNQEGNGSLGVGEVIEVSGVTFQVASIDEVRTENYHALTSTVNVLRSGNVIRSFHPEHRHYPASQSNASEAGIGSTLFRDFYAVLSGIGEEYTREHPIGVFHFYINPLVIWIWIGSGLVAMGTALCMIRRSSSQRTRSTPQTTAGAAT